MKIAEVWDLFGLIVQYYPSFAGRTEDDDAKAAAWLDVLRDVPYERAKRNLLAYAAIPDNRFPPHPGALAVDERTDVDRYHDAMKVEGAQAIAKFAEAGHVAVPPTPEQCRKVREIFAKYRD